MMHKLRGNHAQAQRGWSSNSDKARRLAFDMDQDTVVDSCLVNPTFVKTRLNVVGQKKTRRPVLTGRVGGREAGRSQKGGGQGTRTRGSILHGQPHEGNKPADRRNTTPGTSKAALLGSFFCSGPAHRRRGTRLGALRSKLLTWRYGVLRAHGNKTSLAMCVLTTRHAGTDERNCGTRRDSLRPSRQRNPPIPNWQDLDRRVGTEW